MTSLRRTTTAAAGLVLALGLAPVVPAAGTAPTTGGAPASRAAVSTSLGSVGKSSAEKIATRRNATTYRTRQTRWATPAELATGKLTGLKVTKKGLRLARDTARSKKVRDPFGNQPTARYDAGIWQSPWTTSAFDATNLVPSWNAIARKGALVRVLVRVADGSDVGSWDEVATWGFAHDAVRRHSGAAQSDDLARLSTDTVLANGSSFNRWQVRVVLLRPAGTGRAVRLDSVGATVADYTSKQVPVSRKTAKPAIRLQVPTYSQMVHAGHHPEWGNGGEAWCSPTSMAMVMRFHGAGPKANQLRWEKGVDPVVDHAARETYDHRYRGTGNWPFNTAFAGNYRLDSFVTRLKDLRDIEKMVHRGLPVVTSVKFGRGELDGAPIGATNGHLMVVVGFTANGDVLANDPAGAGNGSVPRSYDRAQFERAWLGGSGGISYLVRPRDIDLPKGNARW